MFIPLFDDMRRWHPDTPCPNCNAVNYSTDGSFKKCRGCGLQARQWSDGVFRCPPQIVVEPTVDGFTKAIKKRLTPEQIKELVQNLSGA